MKLKNIIKGVIFGVLTVAMIIFIVYGCNHKQAKADTIYMFDNYTATIKGTFYNPNTSGMYNGSFELHDTLGYPVRFKTAHKNESEWDNRDIYLKFWGTKFWGGDSVGTFYIDVYWNREGRELVGDYETITISMNYALDGNYFVQSVSSTTNYYLLDSMYNGLNVTPYKIEGDYSEYLQGRTIDTSSEGWRRFETLFNYEIKSYIDKAQEYQNGYNFGFEQGEKHGIYLAQDDPHKYNLYDYDDLQADYQKGLELGQEGTAKSLNWFLAIFDGISSVFSIKIFGGSITLGMLCLVPFAIEFVFIIFKIIRGGD